MFEIKQFINQEIKKANIIDINYVQNILVNIFALNGRILKNIYAEDDLYCFEIDHLNVYSNFKSDCNWSINSNNKSKISIEFSNGKKIYLNDKNDKGIFEIKLNKNKL